MVFATVSSMYSLSTCARCTLRCIKNALRLLFQLHETRQRKRERARVREKVDLSANGQLKKKNEKNGKCLSRRDSAKVDRAAMHFAKLCGEKDATVAREKCHDKWR